VLAGGDLLAASQRPPQPRDVDLDGLGRRRRRLLAPQLVDQAVAAERLPGVQEQHRQQRPLPRAADRHHTVAVDDLQWPEDAEFDAQSRDRTGPAVTALKPGRGTIRRAELILPNQEHHP
jgi:hypothetical protein